MPAAEKFMGIVEACGGRFLPVIPSDQYPGHYIKIFPLLERTTYDAGRRSLQAEALEARRPNGVHGRCKICKHWVHFNPSDEARHNRLFHGSLNPIIVGEATEDEGESAGEHPIDADGGGDNEGMDGAAAAVDSGVNDAVVVPMDEEPAAPAAAAHPVEPVAKVSTSGCAVTQSTTSCAPGRHDCSL